MYTTCEAGKRKSVNHTRALARLAGQGRGQGRGMAWRGVARPDVMCRCDAMRCAEMRECFAVESIKTETINVDSDDWRIMILTVTSN